MTSHTRKVLNLYRRLLRLHRHLPDNAMARIGREFVRREFHKHKSASPQFVTSFMKEWTVSQSSFTWYYEADLGTVLTIPRNNLCSDHQLLCV